ncbi:hypothetical protein HMPREF0290_2036 [Corynebacterium efficiens YS-314]|nr:hypothetical protein HMPREF0290_2036 [Corynebacterium efficiens YS-314]
MTTEVSDIQHGENFSLKSVGASAKGRWCQEDPGCTGCDTSG